MNVGVDKTRQHQTSLEVHLPGLVPGQMADSGILAHRGHLVTGYCHGGGPALFGILGAYEAIGKNKIGSGRRSVWHATSTRCKGGGRNNGY